MHTTLYMVLHSSLQKVGKETLNYHQSPGGRQGLYKNLGTNGALLIFSETPEAAVSFEHLRV